MPGHTGFIPKEWNTDLPLSIPVDAIEHANLMALEQNGDAIFVTALELLPQDAEAMAYARHMYELDGIQTFWGLLPGWTDAGSPIHLNMHDKQATTFALLEHMQTQLPANLQVQMLVESVKDDRATFLQDNPGFASVCRYSQTGFGTAHISGIEWNLFVTHGPSAMAAGASALLVGALLFEAGVRIFRRKRQTAQQAPATPMWQPAPLTGPIQ